MGKYQDIIIINGKQYDVRKRTDKPVPAKKTVTTITAPKPAKNIDGFISGKSTQKAPKIAPQKQVIPARKTESPAHSSRSTHHVVAHKTEKAKTLMRSGLAKPRFRSSAAEKDLYTQHAFAKNTKRAKRAKAVEKSSLINKFHSYSSHAAFVHKTNAPNPTKPINSQPATANDAALKPVAPSKPKNQAVATSVSAVSKSEKLFTDAIAKAKDDVYQPVHKKHKAKSKKKTAAKWSAGLVTIALVIGFAVVQSLPLIYIKMASSKAGFSAQYPDYQPSGFSLQKPIQSSPGQIIMQYLSASDERNFSIIQKVSNWNSKSLVENFLQSNNKTFQTIQDNGKTIYIYDDTSATWVSGGIWYQIEGNSKFNNDQLVRLASSFL